MVAGKPLQDIFATERISIVFLKASVSIARDCSISSNYPIFPNPISASTWGWGKRCKLIVLRFYSLKEAGSLFPMWRQTRRFKFGKALSS